MLLAVDCGNTHIVIGVYDGKELVRSWRLSTDINKTEDEYLALIRSMLGGCSLHLCDMEGMVMGSVVPAVTITFRKLARKHLDYPAFIVDCNTPTGLKICMDNPAEVGADRIVNSLAGHEKYGGDLIIVDFGTATTFDCVSAEGEYLGGAICPGIEISQQALFSHAAKLASIDLYRPATVIGRNTADSLRSGILWGYGGQVDSIVYRMRKEWGREAKVVSTGGLASFIKAFSDTIEIVDNHLTLDGLRLVWEYNAPQILAGQINS